MLHRLQLFYRSSAQWIALFLPLLFVTMMCFNFYSITKSVVKDPEALKVVVPMMLKIFFGFFLTIGYTFIAGGSAILPMQEKKIGLRHMMQLFGVNTIQYWIGMAIADWIIVLIPACCYSLLLLAFEDIMDHSEVPEFFIVFLFFGCAMNVLSYCLSHLFSDPDTGIKYLSLIYVFGFFIGPIVGTSIIAGIVGEDQSAQDGFSFWFFFSPLITFSLVTQNICYKSNDEIDGFKVSGDIEADYKLALGVLSYQIVILFLINLLIDNCIRNSYKKRGGKDAKQPRHLEVHQDVKDHEQQVRDAANKQPDDPEYF